MLLHFSREDSTCLAKLVGEAQFRKLRIYEPGLIGPFRKFLRELPGYQDSFFMEGVERGEFREGVQCQDLTKLTFENNRFDLVLSSDIFEHVRRPFGGFREVDRVLKPGGYHIFSIPLTRPMPAATVFRVDTSGPQDVPVLPEHYHGAPMGGRSLVYTDFGADMTALMTADAIELQVESPCSRAAPALVTETMLTFYWQKRSSFLKRNFKRLSSLMSALTAHRHRHG